MILIIGGAGFIGSNLAEHFVKQNFYVKILDNFSTGRSENLSKIKDDIEIIKGDVRELRTVKKAVEDVEYIFHLAALTSVSRSVNDPINTNAVNITGTINVLTSAKDSEVIKVIYASSSSTYGDTPTLPKKEDMCPSPLSPYAVSKLTGEYYCKAFYEVYGLETVSLRYFNVYGPKQDPESEYAAVIPKFITALINKKAPIILGDGNQSRDFTYVKDVVQANFLAMDKGGAGEVFNIGSGTRITINSLAKEIGESLNYIKPIHSESRSGDVRHSLADISKARDLLGYQPRYSLKEGLRETIGWFEHGQ